MPGEHALVLHMHELLQYLNRQGATTFLTVAQHGLVGDMKAPVDVTYLADTVVLLRFFEALGHVRRAISVMKKRTGAHEETIREYRIGKSGITLGEPLENFQGILQGVPMLIGKGAALLKAEDLKRSTVSERALILAPGAAMRTIAAAMLHEAGVKAESCPSLPALLERLDAGAAVVIGRKRRSRRRSRPLDAGSRPGAMVGPALRTARPVMAVGSSATRGAALSRHIRQRDIRRAAVPPTTLVSLARRRCAAGAGSTRPGRGSGAPRSEARYRTLFETIDEGFCVIEFLDGPDGRSTTSMSRRTRLMAPCRNLQRRRSKVRTMVPDEAAGWVELYRWRFETGEPVRRERELVATRRYLEVAAFSVEPESRRQVAVLFQDVTPRQTCRAAIARELNEGLEERVETAIAEREAAAAQLHEAEA